MFSCTVMCAIPKSNTTQSEWSPLCGWESGSTGNAVSPVSSVMVLTRIGRISCLLKQESYKKPWTKFMCCGGRCYRATEQVIFWADSKVSYISFWLQEPGGADFREGHIEWWFLSCPNGVHITAKVEHHRCYTRKWECSRNTTAAWLSTLSSDYEVSGAPYCYKVCLILPCSQYYFSYV